MMELGFNEYELFTISTDGDYYYCRNSEGVVLASIEIQVRPETPASYFAAMTALMAMAAAQTMHYMG